MPGPNDTLQCGTGPGEGRLPHHRAHSQICPRCEPDVEWTGRCPTCFRPVPVVGVRVQSHPVRDLPRCPGTGAMMDPPPLVDRPIRRPDTRTRQQRALALVGPRGGAA